MSETGGWWPPGSIEIRLNNIEANDDLKLVHQKILLVSDADAETVTSRRQRKLTNPAIHGHIPLCRAEGRCAVVCGHAKYSLAQHVVNSDTELGLIEWKRESKIELESD